MDLKEKYLALVAKNSVFQCIQWAGSIPLYAGGSSIARPINEGLARDIISAHLLSLLPGGMAIMRSHDGHHFIMVSCEHLKYCIIGNYHDNPTDCLIEFFLLSIVQ